MAAVSLFFAKSVRQRLSEAGQPVRHRLTTVRLQRVETTQLSLQASNFGPLKTSIWCVNFCCSLCSIRQTCNPATDRTVCSVFNTAAALLPLPYRGLFSMYPTQRQDLLNLERSTTF